MGSINAFEKSRLGGRPPGKINASLNEKLRTVKWGKYKTSELFQPQKITNMLSKEDLSEKFNFPAYSSESTNNGIIGYTDSPEFICDDEHPVFVTFGDHTCSFNIATKSFSVLDNVKVLLPSIHNIRCLLWIITAWQKQIPNLGYARHWKIAKNCIVELPTKDGEIDFDFMESFVAELEAQRVAELEAQRVAELEAYLSVTGLKDTHLSFEEEQALLNFNKITFDEYKLTDVFDIKNAGNILSKDIVENSGKTPYLCASSENNAVSSYISYKDELKTKGNCIFIGGKTFVVTYQESDFFSNDSHNLALYLKEAEYRNKYTQMYLATCVNKSLNHKYTWGNSISNKKAQKDYISLPTKDGKIDFNSMSTLISAIHKLVIKDVVRYADEKIEKTKEAINSNTN